MRTSTLVIIVLVLAGTAITGLVLLRHRRNMHFSPSIGQVVTESAMCATADAKAGEEIYIPMRTIVTLFKKGKVATVIRPSEGCFRTGQVVTAVGSKRTFHTHQLYFRRLQIIVNVDKISRLNSSERDSVSEGFLFGDKTFPDQSGEWDRIELSNPSGPSTLPPEKGPDGHPMARILASFQDLVSKYNGPINLLSFPDVRLGPETANFPKKIVPLISTKIEDPEDPESHGFSPEITEADANKVWVVIARGPGDMRSFNAITQLSLRGAKYVYWLRKPPR